MTSNSSVMDYIPGSIDREGKSEGGQKVGRLGFPTWCYR